MSTVHARDLASVDLNLLVVLDVLLAERHVTRAAKRLGVTQSAVSHGLARLRDLLGDPLLLRGAGGAMLPTARADAIAPALRAALTTLESTLSGEPTFDPRTASRAFHVVMGDYSELVLLPALVAMLQKDAPGIDVWAHGLAGDPAQALVTGALDCALGVWPSRAWPSGFFAKNVYEDTFVCVVRRGHPAARQRLTLPRYTALSHLLVAPGGRRGGVVDEALAALGRTRRVAVVVPHFLVAPYIVAASDLVVTLASRIARIIAKPLGLEILKPPLELRGFTMSLVWHERAHRDPAHRWFRERITEIGASL